MSADQPVQSMAVKPRLSDDTADEIEQRQIEGWRAMSATEKAALVTSLTQASVEITRAGIRHRHPGATEREIFLRLAIILLGRDLACRAYPDAAQLTVR